MSQPPTTSRDLAGASVDVVLPALDEALAIDAVLASLPDGYRPIVVDNGSTDDTAARARRNGALVVHEPRRGYGAACDSGLRAANADIVCFMDADGSLDGADLPALVAPVREHRAELVVGARRARAGTWPAHARLANRFLARRLRRKAGLGVTDVGPVRACRRSDLLALGLQDRRFGWPLELMVAAAAAGWRVAEVPVDYRPRLGRSKVTGTVRGTLAAARDMAAFLP
jgi:glycosyltransferase involved in cell wall biosynthesis